MSLLFRHLQLKFKMVEEGPSKSELDVVFKRLRAIQTNKVKSIELFSHLYYIAFRCVLTAVRITRHGHL